MEPKRLLKALRNNAGFPPDLARADIDRAQAALQHRDPARAQGVPVKLSLALVEASVEMRDPIFAQSLVDSADRELAKAAKKALYRLRSAGVDLPESPAPTSPTATAPVVRETHSATVEEFPALLSSVTGNGERALLMTRALRGGGLELAQLVLSDELGVMGLELHETSRSSLRKTLRVLRADREKSAVEISDAEARRLLAHSVALNLERNTPFPPGLDATLRRMDVKPARQELEVPEPQPTDAAASLNAASLHAEPELRGWLPPMTELEPFAHKVNEVLDSPLYLDEVQRQAQLERVIDEAAQAFLTFPMRQLYARRLWTMGHYFFLSGRAERGALAHAEARRLFHVADGALSAFIREMFVKVLALSAAREAARAKAGEGKSPPAVPHPSSGETSSPVATERRSPGGLILP